MNEGMMGLGVATPFMVKAKVFTRDNQLKKYVMLHLSNTILPKPPISKSKNETGIPFIYLSCFSYEIDSVDHLPFSYLKAASLLYTLGPNSTDSTQAITASSTGEGVEISFAWLRSDLSIL